MTGALIRLYGKLDPQSVRLFGRFIAKCLSREDPNSYFKSVMLKEVQGDNEDGEKEDG